MRTTLLALSLAGALLAQAPPPAGPMHRPAPPGDPAPLLRALGLSKDQEEAVQALLAKRRPAAQALRKAAFAREDALRAALEDPAAGESALRALFAAASEARLQEALDHHAMAQALDALLTPEQRAKARRIRDNQQRERAAHQAVTEELGPGAGPCPPL